MNKQQLLALKSEKNGNFHSCNEKKFPRKMKVCCKFHRKLHRANGIKSQLIS